MLTPALSAPGCDPFALWIAATAEVRAGLGHRGANSILGDGVALRSCQRNRARGDSRGRHRRAARGGRARGGGCGRRSVGRRRDSLEQRRWIHRRAPGGRGVARHILARQRHRSDHGRSHRDWLLESPNWCIGRRCFHSRPLSGLRRLNRRRREKDESGAFVDHGRSCERLAESGHRCERGCEECGRYEQRGDWALPPRHISSINQPKLAVHITHKRLAAGNKFSAGVLAGIGPRGIPHLGRDCFPSSIDGA